MKGKEKQTRLFNVGVTREANDALDAMCAEYASIKSDLLSRIILKVAHLSPDSRRAFTAEFTPWAEARILRVFADDLEKSGITPPMGFVVPPLSQIDPPPEAREPDRDSGARRKEGKR